jgi:uncharacterized protein
MTTHCPHCVDGMLTPKLRDGVEIDVCSSCRGVWLDRGELEKLLSLAAREVETYGARDSEPPSSRRGYSDRRGSRKKSLVDSLRDIFD